MESSYDYSEGTKLILFWEGENPDTEIPEGWIVIDRAEPSDYKGFKNAGCVICRPPEDESRIQSREDYEFFTHWLKEKRLQEEAHKEGVRDGILATIVILSYVAGFVWAVTLLIQSVD